MIYTCNFWKYEEILRITFSKSINHQIKRTLLPHSNLWFMYKYITHFLITHQTHKQRKYKRISLIGISRSPLIQNVKRSVNPLYTHITLPCYALPSSSLNVPEKVSPSPVNRWFTAPVAVICIKLLSSRDGDFRASKARRKRSPSCARCALAFASVY